MTRIETIDQIERLIRIAIVKGLTSTADHLTLIQDCVIEGSSSLGWAIGEIATWEDFLAKH